MVINQKYLWAGLGFLGVVACCIGVILGGMLAQPNSMTGLTPSVSSGDRLVSESTPTPILVIVDTATPLPVETPTAVPTLPPATQPPVQSTSDFDAMVQYAEAITPILEEGVAAAERDSDILDAAKQDPNAFCGQGLTPHPTLVADAALMKDLANRLESIIPPAEAAEAVHKPLKESMLLWNEALESINLSCQTDNQTTQGFLRLGAALQLGGSLLNFQTATGNFWRLIIGKGLEEIVGPQ